MRASTIILTEEGVRNLRIETVPVEERDFEETAFTLGRIEAIPRTVGTVSSRIAGRVVELKVAPGDMVEAGAIVARVESRQPGDPPPVIPLRAPVGGMVTALNVHLGDPVEPDKNLLEITDLREVYAVARVPEHIAGRTRAADAPDTTKAGGTATAAHITVTALPREKFDGKLLRFGTSADRESGTIDAIFQLTNPGGLLRPGMRAEFNIVLSKRSGVMSVPRAAIQGDPATRHVYVKDFELPHAFIKTPVVVGEMNDRYAEIISGVLVVDEVVTRGSYSLGFVGGGTISLKEALDAAHGHEHAEDGGELTEAQRQALRAKRSGGSDNSHGHEHGHTGVSDFWMYTSAALFVLLLLSLAFRGGGGKGEDGDGSASGGGKHVDLHESEVKAADNSDKTGALSLKFCAMAVGQILSAWSLAFLFYKHHLFTVREGYSQC